MCVRSEPVAKALSYGLLALLMAAYASYTFQLFGFIPQYVSDEVYYVSAAHNLLVAYGLAPNATVPVPNYLNLEHPPLAKYLIALSIWALGLRPYAWRLPGWALGEAALLLAYLVGVRLTERWGLARYAGGLAAASALALDPNYWVQHGLALLDPYAGFFGLLALYLALRAKGTGGLLLAALAVGLAAASKETAAPLAVALAVYAYLKTRRLLPAAAALLIPLATYLALSAPLMALLGLDKWLAQGPLHMAGWDVESGHLPPYALGQISTPWGWLLDINPFYMGLGLYASTSPPLLLAWLALSAYAFALRDRDLAAAASFPLSIYLALWLVYALGNHTLLSFYVSSFSPMSDAFVGAALVDLTARYLKAEGARGAWRP